MVVIINVLQQQHHVCCFFLNAQEFAVMQFVVMTPSTAGKALGTFEDVMTTDCMTASFCAFNANFERVLSNLSFLSYSPGKLLPCLA